MTVENDEMSVDVQHEPHLLNAKWTMWYDYPSEKKATIQNWKDQLKSIVTVASIEDFWL